MSDSRIIVVSGVSGAGKTTIGRRLAEDLNSLFLDADSLHSKESIGKMSACIPLCDADRQPWIARTHAQMLAAWQRRAGLVVACSALKQMYRDELARGIPVRWIYLKGPASLIERRLSSRSDHYMQPEMLPGQLRDLEEPKDAIVVDISATPEEILRAITAALRKS